MSSSTTFMSQSMLLGLDGLASIPTSSGLGGYLHSGLSPYLVYAWNNPDVDVPVQGIRFHTGRYIGAIVLQCVDPTYSAEHYWRSFVLPLKVVVREDGTMFIPAGERQVHIGPSSPRWRGAPRNLYVPDSAPKEMLADVQREMSQYLVFLPGLPVVEVPVSEEALQHATRASSTRVMVGVSLGVQDSRLTVNGQHADALDASHPEAAEQLRRLSQTIAAAYDKARGLRTVLWVSDTQARWGFDYVERNLKDLNTAFADAPPTLSRRKLDAKEPPYPTFCARFF